ncbi:MAG: hypothetical protein Q4A16_07865 [Lautropia sp.]|nr:hypothetical protein [Lautropia sp.]
MNALGWLILGLLVGWAIEFAIDFFYWRKKAQLEAEALVQQEALLLAQQTELGHKQSALRLREKDMADLQASLATRDAELLQAARRIEERSDDLGRLEQHTEKRRADLDRMSMTLTEREKDISIRGDQLKSKEADYSRRLDALEATEQELARRVAVVANREDAMQSWEGRILSREHDVADREASVNYHASRIAADAGAFDAAKHLLKQLYRTPEGRDNLQVLVGIDPKVADLLRDAGIRSFERLAETSLGELTRILEGAGPRFALANPLSWAEQAGHWLNEDYIALDRLQCELLGIERKSIKEPLFAEMAKPRQTPAAEAAAAAAAAVGAAGLTAAATDEQAGPVGVPVDTIDEADTDGTTDPSGAERSLGQTMTATTEAGAESIDAGVDDAGLGAAESSSSEADAQVAFDAGASLVEEVGDGRTESADGTEGIAPVPGDTPGLDVSAEDGGKTVRNRGEAEEVNPTEERGWSKLAAAAAVEDALVLIQADNRASVIAAGAAEGGSAGTSGR